MKVCIAIIGGIFRDKVLKDYRYIEPCFKYFNKNVIFGDFFYETPSLNNKKLIDLFNQADRTSMEVINKFLDIIDD